LEQKHKKPMNRLFQFLLVITAFVAFACAGSQNSTHTDHQDNDTTATTTQAAADLFAVAVLVDTIPSPRKEMTATVDGVSVTVNYGSPSVKGRTIWGDLVPYDKVWRAGANEATTIEVSKDVNIEGQTLPAGKYAFFTIPGENDWTLIFNEDATLWGAYEYDENKDVMRVKVVPTTTEAMSETMEFSVQEGGQVVLSWDKLQVPFAVKAG
jgi:hypothetical protein